MARMQRVQVTRNFRHNFEGLGAGSVIDLELPVAQELHGAQKVEFVDPSMKLVKLPVPEKVPQVSEETTRIASLEAQIAGLTALVEKMSQKPAGKAAAKESANA
jgi:hypothetical protein